MVCAGSIANVPPGNSLASRVKSVSYGEERPADGRSTETAWAMNRRAEFVITYSQNAPVQGTTGG